MHSSASFAHYLFIPTFDFEISLIRHKWQLYHLSTGLREEVATIWPCNRWISVPRQIISISHIPYISNFKKRQIQSFHLIFISLLYDFHPLRCFDFNNLIEFVGQSIGKNDLAALIVLRVIEKLCKFCWL